MFTFYLVSLSFMIAYTAAALIILKQVPQSYSNTRYLFSTKNELVGQVAFWLWTVICGLPLLIYWLDGTAGDGWKQVLIFFSVAGLSFVGAAEDYLNSKITADVHYLGAAAAALLSQSWALVHFGLKILPLIIVFFGIAAILGKKVKAIGVTPLNAGGTGKPERDRSSMMFFLEVAAFSLVYIEVPIAILLFK